MNNVDTGLVKCGTTLNGAIFSLLHSSDISPNISQQ